MMLNNEFKKQMIQIELNFLQLLCIQEVVFSIEHVYSKQNKGWPDSAKDWQFEVAELIYAVIETKIVTQLISTTLSDKFVPKGYPKETFHFINSLTRDLKQYELLFKEFVPNQVVSDEKLLFFSSQIQTFLKDAKQLTSIFPFEKPSIYNKLLNRNEADYFVKALHQFFYESDRR